jgi:hypothetical protein
MAGEHEVIGWAVIGVMVPEGADERILIGALGHFWKEIADF